ncbi:MAG: hypothetical protein MMC33_000153 [Icmadophila ericetorum]|nr:hypothetical protein [Icmadophila ericetorum]
MPIRKIPKGVNGTNGTKRKAESRSTDGPSKKTKSDIPVHPGTEQSEEYYIVDREFYPPEMANSRCLEYNENKLPRPIEVFSAAQKETKAGREVIPVRDAVVHWFKCDLRLQDNKGLYLASKMAKSKGVPLICMYIISPQDFKAHMTAPARVDFILRTLEVLKEDLAKLDIPLYVETIENRKEIPSRIFEMCEKWGASHLFANIEYEVDELRREARMTRTALEKGLNMTVVPDTCVVAPGELQSQTGRQYAVYTPWFRAWVAYLHLHMDQLDLFDPPAHNPSGAREKFKDTFAMKIPDTPENKKLTDEEKKRFRSMWPPGEHEAQARLKKFLEQKAAKYADMRNIPSENGTAVVSVHFASGTLSARTAIHAARNANSSKKLDAGIGGIMTWISEVAWRDFYKHVLAQWPFVCMNKPFKPEYTNIEWEYDMDTFKAWCEGRTGYPIVDAAMRQLNHMAYMHNRCRMIVASFLAKDLLIDWRMGERYFMEHLIDGDFASNNGGWGFSASTGVDPQPYFRIFNPLLQSEKFDTDGAYIRKWVPELREVTGKAIHDPYNRGAKDIAEKNGYPRVVVDHKVGRDRALAKYKAGLGRDTA